MKALEGIRMLELTHMVSGPYAGMLLADLGVESIKVEQPERGELTRTLMADDPKFNVHGMGPYFTSLNRNKKSITLNLKSAGGLEIFYELVKVADIVLNNFSVGVTARLKIDSTLLSEINPRIITCSITGFGETGPENDRPSYDMVAQAMSGVMSITGQSTSPPTRAGIPISDVTSSLMAATGIMAALVARSQTGRGQHVDISMLDSQVSSLNYMAAISLMSGEHPERIGNSHRAHVPYEVYACTDGHIILAVVTDEFWQHLTQTLNIGEVDTAENKTRSGRIKNREIIDQALEELFLTKNKAYWLKRLRAARIPCAPVNNFMEAFEDPQLKARNMIVEVEYPDGQQVRMVGNPIKLSETYEDTFSPSPLVGQHNSEILGELLGKSKEELEQLGASKII